MIEQVIYFSDLFPKKCPKTYRGLVEVLDRYEVEHRLLKGTRDIWCRDYMPIEVYLGHFVAWGYNPESTNGKVETNHHGRQDGSREKSGN